MMHPRSHGLLHRFRRLAATMAFLLMPGWLPAQEKPRIVSLSPSLSEIIVQLGRGDCLVGRSSACDYPLAIKDVPVCGDFGKPSIEAILSLRATHLAVADLENPALADSLRRAEIVILCLPTNRIDDYYGAVAALGKALNATEAAVAEIRRVREGIESFRRELRDAPEADRPSVYFEVWDNPPMTVGRDSYLHDLIELAGGRNLGADQPGGYFHCNAEWVITNAPEIIIAPAMTRDKGNDISLRPGWESIPAVRNGRIYAALDQDILYRLGPRLLDGLRLLHACIHPPSPEPTLAPRESGTP
jgi:iron complex transport system substrate-binding protein